MKIFTLMLMLISVGCLNAQNIESSPIVINEIGVMPFTNSKYLELVVTGQFESSSDLVNLDGWIIDNNSDAHEEDSLYMVLGDCFNGVESGSIILLYDDANPHPLINPANDGTPNLQGVYQLPYSDSCISKCVKDGDYICVSNVDISDWSTTLPLSESSDALQLRAPNQKLEQAVHWGNMPFTEIANSRTTNIPEDDVFSSISLESRCNVFDYDYKVKPMGGTPGEPNSDVNALFISLFSTTSPPPPPSLEISCEAVPSSASSNGIINVTISGGSSPYLIYLNGPSSAQMLVYEENTYQFADLPQGMYTVTVSGLLSGKCPKTCEATIIELVESSLCEGECTSIGEENPSSMNSYLWEPFTEFENPNTSYQENICPTESTSYFLHIFDENCSLIETREYEIVVNTPLEVDLNVVAGLGGVCGMPVDLEATEGFTNYSWSEGTSGINNSITISAYGTYEVTATDENGCTSYAQLELNEDNIQALIIKNKLEERGFYGIPIGSIQPAVNVSQNLVVTTDYALQSVNIIDDQLNVAEEFDQFLQHEFFDFISFEHKHSYVTNNSSLCEDDPDLFKELSYILEEKQLGFWAHIWENPDSPGDGTLYVLGRSPNSEGFATVTSYGDMLLQEMLVESEPLEQESLDKEIIYVIQDDMADYYEFYRTPENVNRESHNLNCDPAQLIDITALNSAQVPIKIGQKTSVTYLPPEKIKSNADPQALMAFYKNGLTYSSYYDPVAGTHSGFKSERSAAYYEFPDLTGSEPLLVYQGYLFPDDDLEWCPTKLVFSEYNFSSINWNFWQLWDPYPTGEAAIVSDFETSGAGDLFQSQLNPNYYSSTCMPPISLEQFNTPLYIINNLYNYQGVLKLVNTAWATDAWIFGTYTAGDPHVQTYYIWNCNVGKWEEFTPPEDLSPEFDFIWAVWDAVKESGHLILDVAGMIPVVGEPADILNGIWYTYEGELVDAGISFGSVLVPLAVTRIAQKLIIKNAVNNEEITTILIDANKIDESSFNQGVELGVTPIKSTKVPELVTLEKRMERSTVIAIDPITTNIAEEILNRAQQEVGFLKAWEFLAEIYPGSATLDKAERLWDINLIEKVMDLRADPTFMNALGATIDEQEAALKKIIKANYKAPCEFCPTSGAVYLENIDVYLGRVKNFVLTHVASSNPTQGANQILSLMKNGQKYQIESIAQTVRLLDEGIITNVSKFEIKLNDLLGNPFLKEKDDVLKNNIGDILVSSEPVLKLIELKSWRKSMINKMSSNNDFIDQFKSYIFVLAEDINAMSTAESLLYSFDIKKVLNTGDFNSVNEAELIIRSKFQAVLANNLDNWLDDLAQLEIEEEDFFSLFNAIDADDLIAKINNLNDDDVYSFIKIE